jgi:hypothetical protein
MPELEPLLPIHPCLKRGDDEVPPGTFHGDDKDEVPPGTFHGEDEVPPGTFH